MPMNMFQVDTARRIIIFKESAQIMSSMGCGIWHDISDKFTCSGKFNAGTSISERFILHTECISI